MGRQEAIALIEQHLSELREQGVRSLTLFGSFARDEAGPDSDLDLLVEFEGRTTFDGYMAVKLLLEDGVGRRVDLVTKASLREALRPAVEQASIRVA
jgi:hypothetical protein